MEDCERRGNRNDETTLMRTRIEELERENEESQTTITAVRGELRESDTTIAELRTEIRNRNNGPDNMGRRIVELEDERRRAQTTITETRNERDASRQLADTLHRANEGLRRTVLNLERQAAGAPSSWGEERQTLTTERDDAIARTRTLRRE